MNKASSRATSTAHSPTERAQHWIAAVTSAVLHLLLVLLAMWAAPITVSTEPGGDADAGSRMAVDFVGVEPPPPGPSPASTPVASPPPPRRVQSTPVPRADDPVPPDVPEAVAQDQAPAAAATLPASPGDAPTPRRPSRTWGQPPGLLREDLAPVNAGLSRSPAIERGRRDTAAASAEGSLEVGGYQVYYSLLSEARLRAWSEQGMTEVFMPLPRTRQYLVCPLETALRRESGACRLLEPDSPELAVIGDAREAINMQRVYRQGEVVWRGPGPYR